MSKFTTSLHLISYLLIAGCLWMDFLAPIFIVCLIGLAVCVVPFLRKRQTGEIHDTSLTSPHDKTSIMEDLDREARRRKEVEQLERN